MDNRITGKMALQQKTVFPAFLFIRGDIFRHFQICKIQEGEAGTFQMHLFRIFFCIQCQLFPELCW